ncbi:MAG: hypothetical protein Q4E86_07990, partial [Lachnospiraceae bacterium]|nr:hypothetical protein [Lachnospiraceae bacterium]
YFTEEGRDACFIRERGTGKLLGFVMINTYMRKWDSGHSIAEFMILPKFRRNKIGRKAAFACFERYPGNWEISPSYGSEQAYLFWKNVIDEYAGKNKQYEDGIFLFSNCDKRRKRL